MARIEGVDLPRNKRVEIGLTYLFGIGLTRSHEILAATKVSPDVRIKDLTESEVASLREYISKNYTVEGDLRREEQLNIKRLIEIGCYRGMRHRRNLPVNGQRTRTNSRTRKGPKKTVAGRGQKRGARVYLKAVNNPQSYGVAELKGRRITNIVEKPKRPKTDLAVIGIYMYDRNVFEIIKTLKPSNRGELEITDVNNEYLRRGNLTHDILEGWWTDAGTFDSLLRASNLVAQTGANKI